MPAGNSQQRRTAGLMRMPVSPGVVIDTNVVLDWLVFADPSSHELGLAVREQRVRWLVCPTVTAEVGHVMARPLPERWEAARKRALTLDWQSSAVCCADPPPAPCPGLVCRDPDDQKFIDLAIHQRARWLLTRDRALLSLRRVALSFGLGIVTPPAWPGIDDRPTA